MDGMDLELFEAARKALEFAHAPYSGFSVGAAILGDDGRIYSGCNVENAAYPLGNCAEASAISAMLAGGARRIRKVLTIGPGRVPVTPCGGCRQRIREFAAPSVIVICAGLDGGEPLLTTIAELLPHSFGPQFLQENTRGE